MIQRGAGRILRRYPSAGLPTTVIEFSGDGREEMEGRADRRYETVKASVDSGVVALGFRRCVPYPSSYWIVCVVRGGSGGGRGG